MTSYFTLVLHLHLHSGLALAHAPALCKSRNEAFVREARALLMRWHEQQHFSNRTRLTGRCPPFCRLDDTLNDIGVTQEIRCQWYRIIGVTQEIPVGYYVN